MGSPIAFAIARAARATGADVQVSTVLYSYPWIGPAGHRHVASHYLVQIDGGAPIAEVERAIVDLVALPPLVRFYVVHDPRHFARERQKRAPILPPQPEDESTQNELTALAAVLDFLGCPYAD